MIRPLAAAALFAALAGAGPASAQTWGQPVYLNLNAYGRPIGGSPLSEVETRSYVRTGRRADGYSDRPRVHAPGHGYSRPHTRHGSHDRHRGYGDGHRYGHGGGRHEPPVRPGYRDEWGYSDDRPPSARRGRSDCDSRSGHDRGCGCADVYFYDR